MSPSELARKGKTDGNSKPIKNIKKLVMVDGNTLLLVLNSKCLQTDCKIKKKGENWLMRRPVCRLAMFCIESQLFP